MGSFIDLVLLPIGQFIIRLLHFLFSFLQRLAEFVLITIQELQDVFFPSSEAAFKLVFFTRNEDGELLEIDMAQVPANEKLPLFLKAVDDQGNTASVEGAPVWSVSDPAMGELKVADDGLSAEFLPLGPLGSCLVQASADADLGPGVATILGELQVDVISGQATKLELSAGAPAPKDAAPAA